ncbi:MAG: low temperature requirement protein A [Bacteroidetes bacterium]|nr:low temperature requirement protein A [Bacteroidota bacterium]
MNTKEKAKSLWGAPKKFNSKENKEERKVSWLELFYDLVYVIAIANITHHVAAHFNMDSLFSFLYFFVMIFWGWLNGSLYYDLHGSFGLRTKLVTLWQMLIVAALVVTLQGNLDHQTNSITVVLMIMQLYITYLWWSVGFYDKEHRKYSKWYIICYLITLCLICSTFFFEQKYDFIILSISLITNYIPPFILHMRYRTSDFELNLSSSMSERLGLFTIIIFGELVIGVINGTSAIASSDLWIWINFSLGITIVFTLWWLFFTLVSDRACKNGLFNSSLLEILYIPTLMALALTGACFSKLFSYYIHHDHHLEWTTYGFGVSLVIYLFIYWEL